MEVKRTKWLFSPLIIILIFVGCKADDKSPINNPVMQRHLEDYQPTGDLWGFINAAGEIVIEAKYDDVRAFHDGLAPANQEGIWGYIDKKGEWKIKPAFIKAQPFDQGLARIRFANGLMGLINTNGDTIIPPGYDEIFSRQGDYFVTAKNEQKGIVDRAGKTVLPNTYKDIKIILNNLFAVKSRERYDLLTPSNKTLTTKIERVRRDGLLKLPSGWGLVDSKGYWIVQPHEKTLQKGHGNHVIVERDGKKALLNIKTQKSTTIQCSQLKYLNASCYASRTTEGWQLLDSTGQPLTQKIFDSIYKFNEDVAAYEVDEWWGYIDNSGNLITEPMFALPWNASEGLIRFFDRSGFGFHDNAGRLVINPKFDDLRDFSEGLAAFME